MQGQGLPRAEIEAALARVQAWPGLARSPQLVKFLNYIVHATLDGNEQAIKAYSIAVDVFGRSQSFDPQSDPIVRVQARRLRSALEEYYAAEGAGEPVRFNLPVGRYVPEFVVPGDDPVPAASESVSTALPDTAQDDARQRPIMAQIDDIVLLVLLVGVALGLALVMTQVLAPKPVRMAVPQVPTVAVAEFTSVSTADSVAPSVAGLAVELVTDLGLFPFLNAVYLPRLEPGSTALADVDFELSGIARMENGEVQVTASLKPTGADTVDWSMSQGVPAANVSDALDDLSRGFADQLGGIISPLRREAVDWLAANPDLTGNENEYLCSLLYALYRQTGDAAAGERARSCVRALLSRSPVTPIALGISGALQLDQALRQSPASPDPEPIAAAERQLREAVSILPTSSAVWREYGTFLASTGRTGEAEAAFTSALQLNPADLNALAAYGLMLSLRGPSERGLAMATDAIARAPQPPYWYHEAPALEALRAGDYALAASHATALATGDGELASVIATVAALREGNQDQLNRSIAQLLEVNRFRRFGILPVLTQRLPDSALREQIASDLRAAGIEQAYLDRPF